MLDHYFYHIDYESYTPTKKVFFTKYQDFKNRILTIREEYRAGYIKDAIEIKCQELKERDSSIYKSWEDGSIEEKYKNIEYEDTYEIAMASLIDLMRSELEFYSTVERINFIDVKWLLGYNRFLELYEVLVKYDLVESNFTDFKRFFCLKSPQSFKSNQYETTVLLCELVQKGYVSESTIDSMIERSIIIAKNGKSKVKIVLTKKAFTTNKSKYNDALPAQFPTVNFYNAMSSYGINLKVKPKGY